MTWVCPSLRLRWNQWPWEQLMAGQTAIKVPEGWSQDHVLQGSEGRVKRLHGQGASEMGFAKKF